MELYALLRIIVYANHKAAFLVYFRLECQNARVYYKTMQIAIVVGDWQVALGFLLFDVSGCNYRLICTYAIESLHQIQLHM